MTNRLAPLLAISLATTPAFSQKVGECMEVSQAEKPIRVIVNQRSLEGPELRMYLEAERHVNAFFEQAATNLSAEALRALFADIDSLSTVVREDAKDCLRDHLETGLEHIVSPGDALISQLLSGGDPHLERLATQVLLGQDTTEWFTDRGIRRALKARVGNPQTDPDVRVTILYLFEFAGAFSKTRALAYRMAADEEHPDLARQAAEVVCWVLIKEHDYSGLAKLFRTSTGILKQQAALALASDDNPEVPSGLKGDLSSALIDILGNKRLPPATRGEAIEACARFSDDDKVVSALIGMLEPDNWFFGVVGMHAPTHSLLALVDVLSKLENPEIKRRLMELKSQLGSLDPTDRRAVERELERML